VKPSAFSYHVQGVEEAVALLAHCTGYQGIINAVRLAASASGGQATGANT
jgi:hypothetical protein